MSVDLTPSILAPRRKALVITDANDTVILRADGDLDHVHSAESEVSKYPVERGADRADHVRVLPDKYRATLAFSATPLGQPLQTDRESDVYRTLRALVASSDLVTVISDLRIYRDMKVKAISAPRRVEQGRMLQVEVNFEQLIVSTLQSVAVPADVLDALVRSSAKAPDDTKDQTKNDDGATKQARKKTLAKSLAGLF